MIFYSSNVEHKLVKKMEGIHSKVYPGRKVSFADDPWDGKRHVEGLTESVEYLTRMKVNFTYIKIKMFGINSLVKPRNKETIADQIIEQLSSQDSSVEGIHSKVYPGRKVSFADDPWDGKRHVEGLTESVEYLTRMKVNFTNKKIKMFGINSLVKPRNKETIADQIIDQLSSQDSSEEIEIQKVKK